MHQRINITLPEDTVRLLDRTVTAGSRSRFIDQAIKHYVQTQSKKRLRTLLKEGAIARAERDLAVAEEWFPVDDETWQHGNNE
jgi:CopG family transcriptional regulator/antitoxin EndoAI